MKSIVWLASYPKSGNTWVRAFLANYLFAKDTPLSINKINQLSVGDSVPSMYQKFCVGKFDPANIEQYLSLRTKTLQAIVNNKATVNFVKTHNANIAINDQALIPTKLTRGAIYIIRNPLDVVVSFAKQLALDFDEITQFICQSDRMIDGNTGAMPQFFSDWSMHAESWLNDSNIDSCIVRYEDLIEQPISQFTRLVEWIGLPFDAQALKKAIEFSDFKELQAQEQRSGFVENTSKEPFFNKGQQGQWQDNLTKANIDKIIKHHRGIMDKFDYLP